LFDRFQTIMETRMPTLRPLLLAFTLAVTATTATVATVARAADEYPSRGIRIIVPYAPGGGTDIFSRTLADIMTKRFKQSVIVENRAGANTLIGHQAIAAAAPDGYTFGMISSAMTVLPFTTKAFTLNPVKDFTPLSLLATGNYAIVAHPSVPVNTIADLITYAKANPGKLNMGTAGGAIDLAVALFKLKANIDYVTIAYKGIAPARQALLAGEIQLLFEAIGAAKEYSAAGKERFLATSGGKRDPLAPNIPTAAESGLPGYKADFWWGYGGPAGLSPAITKTLSGAIMDAVKTPEFNKQILNYGNDPIGSTPEELARAIAADLTTWGDAARAANIKPE